MQSYGYNGKVRVLKLFFRDIASFALGSLAQICPPEGLRLTLQRLRGVKIGKHVYLGLGVYIDNVYPHLVVIGDYVTIALNTMIFCHSNPSMSIEIKMNYYPRKVAPVTIKTGAWIGAGCIILAGITIGENAVVGAGSVVTKDVEPYTVVAGNPAKLIRKLEPRQDIGLEA